MHKLLPLALLAGLVLPAGAFAEVRVDYDGATGEVTAIEFPGFVNNVVTVQVSGGNVTVSDTGVNPTAVDASCSASGNTVTCAVTGAAPFLRAVFGDGDDSVTLTGISAGPSPGSLDGGPGADTLTGGPLADVLLGGDGNDTLNGADGSDQLFGNEGNDSLQGGPGSADTFDGGNGSDVFADSADGGSVSYLNQVTNPAGVEVTLDGVANDGNLTQDGGADNVGAGITHVQGSQFADDLEGGPGGDFLSGQGGNDRLVGNGGADSFNGATGDDRIEARDGAADADIDCDNSAGAHGTADVAILDAADPAARNCETADRGSSSGTGGGTGGGGGGGGTGTGGETATGTPVYAPVEEIATLATRQMPNVVGMKIDPARTAVLKVVAGVDLDVQFQKGCRESQDLEVIRQRPARGTTLESFAGSNVPVPLYLCVAERDFLADCDYADLKDDLRALPQRGDAELGLTVLDRFSRCKVDYDIKLARKAQEAQMALDAERRRKQNAEILAGLSCPVSPEAQDLRMGIFERHQATSELFFGPHASGGARGWALPAGPATNNYTSQVDVRVLDRAWRPVEATIFVDAEDVGIRANGRGGTEPRYVAKEGLARILFTPTRPGTIKLCAVLQTGDEQVLTAAIAIRVVGPLKVGDTWTTISRRTIDITQNGPKERETAGRAVARKANVFEDFINVLRSLFGNASQTINQAAGESSVSLRNRVKRITSLYSEGQISLDGRLHPDPQPPVVQQGACFRFAAGAKVVKAQCPTLVAPGGAARLGGSSIGRPVIATGDGGTFTLDTDRTVKGGVGTLIGDGASGLIGLDGAGMIGLDGAGLVSDGGSGLIGVDGAGLIGVDGGGIVGASGSAIGPALAPMVAAGAGNIVAAGAGNIVAAGSLN